MDRPTFEPPSEPVEPATTGRCKPCAARLLVAALLLGAVAWVAWAKFGPTGSGLVAWNHDVPAALDTARQNDQPLLLLFTADWCPPCRQLKAGPLSDAQLAQRIEAEFVPVKVDLTSPGDAEQRAASVYGVQSIPTLIVAAPSDGTEISRMQGGTTNDLHRWLDRFTGPAPVADATP